MLAKKVNVKETPTLALLAGNENRDGFSNVNGKQKLPPTFEEMWFDDPIEGQKAQRLALEIRKNVVLRAEPPRIYLERTGIVPMLLQGLQHLVKARPSDPTEWLAAFLLKNNPRRDMIITQPIIHNSNAKSHAETEAPPTTKPIVEAKINNKKKK